MERVRDEFTKILLSSYSRRGLILLYRLGLLKFIIPELQKCAGIYRENLHEAEDLLGHILDIAASLPPDLNLRLSALLYNIQNILYLDERKEIVVKILQRIRFKNGVIKKVIVLIKENWQALNFSKKINIRQLASRVGMENLEGAWELKKAFIKQNKGTNKYKSDRIKAGENNIREILQERPPVSFNNLTIKGKDLLELGYKEGKELGEILKKILRIVINNPELNQKKILLGIITEHEENVR